MHVLDSRFRWEITGPPLLSVNESSSVRDIYLYIYILSDWIDIDYNEMFDMLGVGGWFIMIVIFLCNCVCVMIKLLLFDAYYNAKKNH